MTQYPSKCQHFSNFPSCPPLTICVFQHNFPQIPNFLRMSFPKNAKFAWNELLKTPHFLPPWLLSCQFRHQFLGILLILIF